MKISIITVEDSEYAFRQLNYAHQIGLPIHSVLVVQYNISKKMKLAKSIFIKRLGWIQGLQRIFERIKTDSTKPRPQTWNGQPLIRCYEKLADNVIYTPDENDPAFIEKLKMLAPDVLLVGSIGILKKKILQIPKIATLNAHTGWLPKYRGRDVMDWTIYHKEFEKIGYTVHIVNEQVDDGGIIGFTPCLPQANDTLETLQNRIFVEASKGIIQAAQNINMLIKHIQPQPHTKTPIFYAIDKEKRRAAKEYLRLFLNRPPAEKCMTNKAHARHHRA